MECNAQRLQVERAILRRVRAVDPEPYHLVSLPDVASKPLRDALAHLAELTGPVEELGITASDVRQLAVDASELIYALLTLRAALIVLMQATGSDAVALPFSNLLKARDLPLRVKHDPEGLPGVLQLLLPADGFRHFVERLEEPGRAPQAS
jgi:hypothetical protein